MRLVCENVRVRCCALLEAFLFVDKALRSGYSIAAFWCLTRSERVAGKNLYVEACIAGVLIKLSYSI